MKIKVSKHVKVNQEIDVDFPLYLYRCYSHEVGGSYETWVSYKENGDILMICITQNFNAIDYEITLANWSVAENIEEMLNDYDKITEEEFLTAYNEIRGKFKNHIKTARD